MKILFIVTLLIPTLFQGKQRSIQIVHYRLHLVPLFCGMFEVDISVLLIPESLAVIIERSPSNAFVLEGGTATFTCILRENGRLVSNHWRVYFMSDSDNSMPFGFNYIDPGTDTLFGANETIQSADTTEIRINGVHRILDGAIVECIQKSNRIRQMVTVPLVYISVQCEFILELSIIHSIVIYICSKRHTFISISVIECVRVHKYIMCRLPEAEGCCVRLHAYYT